MRLEDVEEKVSPMDLSSPDSHKSFAEEVTQSLGTFSLSEDSTTFIAETQTQRRNEEDSLDEISSGEMSSNPRALFIRT